MSIYSSSNRNRRLKPEDIPEEVLDILCDRDDNFEHSDVEADEYFCQILTRYDAVLFKTPSGEEYAIVPNHKHDLRESNIEEVGKHNVKQVFSTSLLGGPIATVYEKVQPHRPAYFVFRGFEEDYHFVEWN